MNKNRYSVSFWIKIILIIFIIPSFLSLIYVNYSIQNNLREQVTKVKRDMLSLYMQQTDHLLDELDVSLNGFMAKNQNIVELQVSADSNDRQLAKYDLYTQLTDFTFDTSKVNGFFVYSESDIIDDDFFTAVNSGGDLVNYNLESKRIQNKLLMAIQQGKLNTGRWFKWKFGEDYYLFRIVYDRNTYLGCYISLNGLLQPLEKINPGNQGFSFMTSLEGQILTDDPAGLVMLDLAESYHSIEMKLPAEDDRQKYLYVSAASDSADLCLVAMIPDKAVLAEYAKVSNVLIIISIIILALIPLSAILVQRGIYHPIGLLTRTMEEVKAGKVDIRADEKSKLKEFYVLSTTFNGMLDEMHHLKIHIYEQQLKEKEAHLQYLQLQIHPHFFLNCMSLMHSLAELGKYREIQKLSRSLVNYFRYMFKKANTMISVGEELQHIKNYMDIQMMRFPDGINYSINMDEELHDALIPPLSIQTFVENSIKYASDYNGKTKVLVNLEKLGSNIKVIVRDYGAGFPADVLTIINSDEDQFEGDETYRIGIRNVKERFKLIFGENAFIHFYNDHGSVTEYVIPIMKEEDADASN